MATGRMLHAMDRITRWFDALAAARLRQFSKAVDAAYQLGYDIGREDGYREGRRVAKPVVVAVAADRRS